MPTFQNTEFIVECLDSVHNQVLTNADIGFDIIIGIDSCLDSLHLLQEIKEKYSRLKIVFFDKRSGPYIVKNTLATLTDADFIVFFDTDDVMTPGFLQGIVNRLEKKEMCLFFYRRFIDNRNDITNKEERIIDFDAIESLRKKHALTHKSTVSDRPLGTKIASILNNRNALRRIYFINFINRKLHRNLFVPGVFAIRRNTFLDHNGYKGWPVAADSEFILRAELNKIPRSYLPPTLAFLRRLHPKSLTFDDKTGVGSTLRNHFIGILNKKIIIHEKSAMQINPGYTVIR